MVGLKLFVVSLLLLYLQREGYALTCYSCSASIGHGAPCENITDHFSDISYHECFYNNAVCAIYKIEYGANIMIYRSCKEAGVCFALSKKFNSQYNKVLNCQTCNENLCNRSPSNLPPIFLHIISVSIFFFCYYKGS